MKNSTVFAPNDVAFDRMRPGLLDEILADSSYARAVVLRHILPGSVLTTKQIKGLGVWENIPGGPLEYQGIGSNVRIANATIVQESSNIECEAGTIHTVDTVLECPTVKPASFDQYYVSPVPHFGDSVVKTLYPAKMRSEQQRRAVGACLPSTTGGRKAMNLVQQLPFWMYGPPFNASKQVDLEPISCAEPEASVDYGVLPPGSVVVTPDEVSAAKLNPISGMSKHVGKMKRLVEGDGQSNYYRLDD